MSVSGKAAVLLLLVVAAAVHVHGQQGGGQRGKTVKKQLKMEPEPDEPEVQLSLGWLNGRWVQTQSGKRVAAFTAVPFAQPPVGELRFKAPVAVEPWDGARESPPLQQVPVCMQHEDTVTTQGLPRSEDCLYLNVFTPSPVNGSNLPVLVWLYGGGFVEGGASVYGPEYLLDGGGARDLVLVTLNYRVGALGFLSTGDAASTGNWGLKDQQLALRWVRQHIAAFGGDPERVTLIGHSAGAVSTHLHLMAFSNRGLFQRAVSLAGSALTLGLPQTAGTARRHAEKLATLVGCPTTASAEMVACLRGKSAAELVAHEADLKNDGLCPIVTWGPVVEDFADASDPLNPPFLEQHPVDVMASGLSLDVPWVAGLNLNDGGFWAAAIKASKQLEAFDANLDTLAPVCFGFNETASPEDLPEVMQEIREFYFGSNNISQENINDLANLFTDGVVLSSLDEAMRLHAAYSTAPGYLYLLSHRGQRSLTDLYGGQGQGRGGTSDLGVVHGDELLHLFPMASILPKGSSQDDPDDRKASEQFIDLLVNFARTGSPTPPGDTRYPFPWKPAENDDLEFIEIGQKGRLFKGAGLLGNRAHFWAALPLSERNVKNMQASSFSKGHDEF
ncbi:venom carboxylesterase-6-like [Thrips palmi]|uniref:Carboxylic ester hydrolase n=1 Tax=Thrips palmi TaxID=161013 RepID=A0A6P9AHQ6_THRPL|nr:venom carboxylesterase-6-like [Thrips palmi]XP_034255022.1 venom carboxylesterase-6-like [Thrips palmi]